VVQPRSVRALAGEVKGTKLLTRAKLGPGTTYEVVVIGAGQAGLAMGSFLADQGRRFIILEREESIGAAWRKRWESLTLFTPRRYDGLPGLPFPGDPDGYPSRDEMILYLQEYARRLDLPVALGSGVRKLSKDNGKYVLEVDATTITADQVVGASPFQQPYVPEAAKGLAPDIKQMHSTRYRAPDDVPAGTALVVGGGNTGFQIAKELSATNQTVLSVGSRRISLPQRLLGRDLFWWLMKSRMLSSTVEPRLGQSTRRGTLIGSSPRELRRRFGVDLRPRVVSASGRIVRFADGGEVEPEAVIWATGYRSDFSWIDLPIFDSEERLRHRGGVTDSPGLYFLGLTWQHTGGSALPCSVGKAAGFIAEQIQSRAQRTAKARS
jgi:putative flavoprotein involved in K+ transport